MKTKPNRTKSVFRVIPQEGEPFDICAGGRQAWMLEQLLQAGAEGITSRQCPGARLSGYVERLRLLGEPIATIREEHSGPFPGVHGVYVLQCQVRRVNRRSGMGGKGDDL